MTGPELKAMAEGLHVNPYYLAYALATGAKSIDEAFARDGHNAEFFRWNGKRWDEQAKAEGVSRELVSIQSGNVDRHIAICAAFIHETVPA